MDQIDAICKILQQQLDWRGLGGQQGIVTLLRPDARRVLEILQNLQRVKCGCDDAAD